MGVVHVEVTGSRQDGEAVGGGAARLDGEQAEDGDVENARAHTVENGVRGRWSRQTRRFFGDVKLTRLNVIERD